MDPKQKAIMRIGTARNVILEWIGNTCAISFSTHNVRPGFGSTTFLLVMEEELFSLKSATAINLLEWDMPRPSVDIGLTYRPMQGRNASLAQIGSALDRVAADIERRAILLTP